MVILVRAQKGPLLINLHALKTRTKTWTSSSLLLLCSQHLSFSFFSSPSGSASASSSFCLTIWAILHLIITHHCVITWHDFLPIAIKLVSIILFYFCWFSDSSHSLQEAIHKPSLDVIHLLTPLIIIIIII